MPVCAFLSICSAVEQNASIGSNTKRGLSPAFCLGNLKFGYEDQTVRENGTIGSFFVWRMVREVLTLSTFSAEVRS